MAMNATEMERRIRALEAELADLKARLPQTIKIDGVPWPSAPRFPEAPRYQQPGHISCPCLPSSLCGNVACPRATKVMS